MIERTLVTGEEKSKYFIHNNRLATEWEKFCSELNGEIVGQVNGAILEFDFIANINEIQVQIRFLRQKSNNTTNAPIDHGYLMEQNTSIEFSPINIGKKEWQISKLSSLDKFGMRMFFGVQEVEYDPEFSFVSKDLRMKNIPFSKKDFETLTQISELKKISYKNEILKIDYFNALGTDSVLKIIQTITAKN